jgi:hypothetical protein
MKRSNLKTLAILVLNLLLLHSACHADFVTLVNNGASSNRVDLVFVGDGYTAGQIETTYAGHVSSMVSNLFNSVTPLIRYSNFFNVHRVNVISNQSGADIPQSGITRDTALDATYRYDGTTDRLLYFNANKANTAVNAAISGSGIDVDMRIGIVNEAVYGGGGGQWAVYAGGNVEDAHDIAIHELGHSFAGLADEYFSPGTHTGGEPPEPNVTANPATGKWNRWLGYNDPTSNIGPIGYYEGGKYVSDGIYRPSDNSIMRSLDKVFDAVGREALIQSIYDHVNPLDTWLSEGTLLNESMAAWVDVVDPNVIDVDWFLDGNRLDITGEMIDVGKLGLAPGSYNLTATAYDNLLDHSFTGDVLDWWRLGPSAVSQSITWTVSISAVPEPTVCGLGMTVGLLLLRRRSGRSR